MATDIVNVNTVGQNITSVTNVANIDSEVQAVSNIASDVTAVANISTDIQDVQDKLAQIQTTANDLNESTSEIETVANAIANVDIVGAGITNINTVASNLTDVNSFATRYRVASSAPSTSLDEGDLYFDTTANKLYHYTGSAWTEITAYSHPSGDGNLHVPATSTTNNGKYLKAGSTAGSLSWTDVDALPTQTGNAGKYLTTDATNPSWETLDTDANSTTKGLYEHAHTISANYSITSGNNALTAGPITINTGYSVTVPTGSTWVIA